MFGLRFSGRRLLFSHTNLLIVAIKSTLRILLVLTNLILIGKITFAQSANLVISHTIVNNHPSWQTGEPIPLCVGVSTLTIKFSNNTGQPYSGVIQQHLPLIPGTNTMMVEPSVSTLSGNFVNGMLNNQGFQFTINNLQPNGNCIVSFDFIISCSSITQDILPIEISYSGNISPVGLPFTFQVSKPKLMIGNFADQNGNLLLNSTNNQLLNLTPQTQRTFELIVSNGIVEEFSFNENFESEINFSNYVIEGYSNGNLTQSMTVSSFQNSSVIIDALFPQGYMRTGDLIRVHEFFSVIKCSPSPDDATSWDVSVPCNPPNLNCDLFIAHRNIFVEDGGNYFTRDLTIIPGLDVCGISPSTISFKFGLSQVNTNDAIVGSGGREINSIVFPLDISWLTIGSIWLVDGNSPGSNGIEITNANFFVIDNINHTCTLNVSQIPQGVEIPPFQDLYLTDGFFHELAEGGSIKIEFRNVLFHCSNSTFYNGGSFSDCTKSANNAMLFGSNAGTNIHINYATMCDMGNNANRTADYEYANYFNNFPMTALAEANPTDVVEYDSPNTSVEFYYSYSGASANPSPFSFNAALSPQNLFFNCNTLEYFSEIWIPEIFDLNLNIGQTDFYSDPNNQSLLSHPVPQFDRTETEAGVNYKIYRLDNIGYEGLIRIRLSVNSTNCPTNTGGFATVRMQLRSICNGCISCAYTIRCIETQIYYHCDGGCTSIVGTDPNSFQFNRSTFGWTDNTLSVPVTPLLVPGIKVNRAYPCDKIDVSASGTIGVNSLLENAFFMIDYTSNANFQFFDYIDGTGYFSFTLGNGGGSVSDDPITQPDLIGFNQNSTSCSLRLFIDPAKLALLNQYGGTVTFSAQFRVREMLGTTPADGFYPISQIRGQFVGEYGGNLSLSCDSWGDNMTILKVRTLRSNFYNGIMGDGMADDSQLMTDQGLCKRWFTLSTTVFGGMPGLDEFPFEFRPIALWPATNSNDFIELDLPNGFSYSPNSSSLGIGAVPPIWNPISTLVSGNTVRFTGLTGNNDWPVVENDGTGIIRYQLKAILNNDCPSSGAPINSASVRFPHTNRGYVIGDPDCAQGGTENITFNNIQASEFSLNMTTTSPQGITMNSNSGVIDGFEILYKDLNTWAGEIASPMQNAWLRNMSNGVQINSIIRTINGVSVIIQPNNFGYFELGNLGHNQHVYIKLNYEITNCQNIHLELEYGFACRGYNEIENYQCGSNTLEVPILITPSQIEMEVTPSGPMVGSPCDEYNFDVEILNNSFGDAEGLSFILGMNPGMSIVSATYSIGSNPALPILFSTNCPGGGGVCVYNFDLNSVVYNGNGMPSLGNVILHFTVTGDCFIHGTTQNIQFQSYAFDICGNEIHPVNNGYNFNFEFPLSIPLGSNCTSNCDSCQSSFTVSQLSNCCYHIQDPSPDSSSCAQYGYTIYDANGTLVASFPDVSDFEHCFNQNGVYTICYHYCCADGTSKDTCQTINVLGCETFSCDDFDLKVTLNDCSYTFSAVLPPNFNGTNISYCWNMGYNGQMFCPGNQTVNFTYPDGTYHVCYKISYFDPATNQMVNCKICKDIVVNCNISNEFCYVIERQATEDDGKVITPLSSSGYLVAGEMTTGSTNNDIYFAHVKDDFTSDYNYLLDESVNSISDLATVYATLEMYPNVYILGKTTDINGSNADLVLLCLNENTHNILWSKRYGTPGMDIGSKILKLDDYTVLITGHTNFYNHSGTNYDLLAMKVDLNGNILDAAVYKPKDKDLSEVSTDAAVLPSPNNQFVIAGYNSGSQVMRDMVALKINYNLTPASNFTFVGNSNSDEWANGIVIQGDYLYLVGASGNIKNQEYHIYVAELKTPSLTLTNASRLYIPNYKTSVANKVVFADNSLVLVGDVFNINGNATENYGTVLRVLFDPVSSKHLDVIWSKKSLKDQKVRFNNLSIYDDTRVLVTGTNNYLNRQQDIFVVNLKLADGDGCCVEPLAFQKKLLAKTYSLGVTQYKPEFSVKPYGKASNYFKLKEICKEDGTIVTASVPIYTKQTKADFKVYPNPNTGMFNIQMNNSGNQIWSVTIFDITGHQVFNKKYSNRKTSKSHLEISAAELASGVYLVQVESSNGKETKMISITK